MVDQVRTASLTTPRFTVVMPAFCADKTIREAISSVLAQTETDFELIVVDDGSTDLTYATAIAAIGHDPRGKVLRQVNAGPSAARNVGLAAASGKLIAFLDADDRWVPTALATHRTNFASRPELGLSFARTRFYDNELRYPGRCSAYVADLQLGQVLAENPICTTSNLVARSDLLLALGGFDSSLTHAEDQELVVRVLATTKWKVGGIDAELVHYRTSTQGLSADLVQMERGWQQMLERARRYADPEEFDAAETQSRALYSRYLARRALRTGGQAGIALSYLVSAFLTKPSALFGAETKRTLMTAIGVLAALVLPRHFVAPLIAR
jgi:glycosyltransferase involved in cell wall biosynthesis